MSETTRVAVLIDCDNISSKVASEILAETATHGTLSIKRGYGDWASPYLSGWTAELARHAIQPIQQFAYSTGKNATDTALIIDAMDLLYSNHVDAFCIVSSDSDFTRLAMRLRESGKRVFGIGERKTPQAFTNACDRFTFTEVLLGQPLVAPIVDSASLRGRAVRLPTSGSPVAPTAVLARRAEVAPSLLALRDVVAPAIETSAKEDGWAVLSAVGSYIVNINPSFDSRNYGYLKLGSLVRDLPFVKVKKVPGLNGSAQLYVRLVGK